MTLVLVAFLVLLLLGMPVAFAIGIAGFLFFLQQPHLPLTMPVQLVLSETQSFSLLAIPMFVFAGNLMNATGVTKRLVEFARVVAGHMWGWLGQVSVILSTLMGGVTGSAIADSAMQARIMGPEMIRRGYSRGWAAANFAFTALITIAIPPGIGLVLYGSIGQVSIGRLFAGGLVPGLLMALAYGIVVSITARRRGYRPERERPAPVRDIARTGVATIWAIMFPILLIVTLRSGLLVPSEAGAAACLYAILVGLLAYRELDWERFKQAAQSSILDTGMIMLLIAMSGLVSYAMKWEMIPQTLTQTLIGLSSNPLVILFIILVFLLLLGTVLDSTVIILLLSAILVPVMKGIGVDLVHFGVLFVITCAVGLNTPPVGLSMYGVCSILDCSVGDFVREGWPFFVAALCVIALMFLFPQVVLWLPNLIFG